MPPVRATGNAVEIDWGSVLPASGGENGSSGDVKLSKGALIAAGVVFVAACALPTIHAYISRKNRSARRHRSAGAQSAVDMDAKTDIKVLLKLEHHEAQSGCEKQVSYNATIGSEIVQRTATLNVPANILDGHIIRLKGWGGSSSKGSPCGDLVLEVLVEDDDE